MTIWNWAKHSEHFEHIMASLPCPVGRKHKKLGFIKAVPQKYRNISIDELMLFLSYLRPIYRDLAYLQFLLASRISEVVGLQWKDIDLRNKTLVITQTARFHSRTKTFIGLNPHPKNRELRPVYIHEEIEAILKRREAFKIPESDFVFHIDGKPLNYGTIQSHYRKAQRNADLKCTGTHVLRHGMAKFARKVGGGLDAVIAITGHKDVKLADHYSKLDFDYHKNTSIKIMNEIRNQMNPVEENVIPINGKLSLVK